MKTNKLWKTVSEVSLRSVRGGTFTTTTATSTSDRTNNTDTFYVSIGVTSDGGTGGLPKGGGPVGPPIGDGATTTYVVR